MLLFWVFCLFVCSFLVSYRSDKKIRETAQEENMSKKGERARVGAVVIHLLFSDNGIFTCNVLYSSDLL